MQEMQRIQEGARHGYLERADGTADVEQRSLFAASLLALLIATICLSPRLRLAGVFPDLQTVDLRWQDLLLLPMALVLVVGLGRRRRGPLISLFGYGLPVFVWGLLLIVASHMLSNSDVSALRRIAFGGRVIELFVLGAVVAQLYLRSGTLAAKTVIGSLQFVIIANGLWVGYQFVTGYQGTLLGSAVGDRLTSYGPKLVGEGSAFAAGQFFTFSTAVGIAQFRSRIVPRRVAAVPVLIGILGVILSESRVSIAGTAFVLLSFAGLSTRSYFGKIRLNAGGLVLASLALATILLIFLPAIQESRFNPERLYSGLQVRVDGVWLPFGEMVLERPLGGLGPGGITPEMSSPEAHNAFLRALVDFGLVFGPLFVYLFLRAMVTALKLGLSSDSKAASMFGYLAFLYTGAVLISGTMQDSMTVVMSTHLLMLALGLLAAEIARHATSERAIIPHSSGLDEVRGHFEAATTTGA